MTLQHSRGELPDLATLLAELWVVRVPLRVPFRGVTEREAVLLRGPAGWGEFSPFLEYDDAEAARWLAAAIDAAYGHSPSPRRLTIPINATVPAVAADEVASVLARFDGCLAVKVKVAQAGQSLQEDLDRVAAVRDQVGPAVAIRVDANAAWSLDDAVDALIALSAYRLEYAEQPVADVGDLARLRILLARKGIHVPIAADESIRKAEDPLRVAREEAADLIVVKVAPLGGVRMALRIVEECGLPAVVSSALDTSVGIAAGIRLAAALPELPYACGLGTVNLLAGDVVANPLVPHTGQITIAAAEAALPTADLLATHSASAERTTWWRERVSRCHGVLTTGGGRHGGTLNPGNLSEH